MQGERVGNGRLLIHSPIFLLLLGLKQKTCSVDKTVGLFDQTKNEGVEKVLVLKVERWTENEVWKGDERHGINAWTM